MGNISSDRGSSKCKTVSACGVTSTRDRAAWGDSDRTLKPACWGGRRGKTDTEERRRFVNALRAVLGLLPLQQDDASSLHRRRLFATEYEPAWRSARTPKRGANE
jgi:hypothetical protein